MDKVLLYTQTLNSDLIASAIDGHAVESVQSTLELAESIVNEKNIFSILIQVDGPDPECRLFLSSLKKVFPFLRVGVITQCDGPVPKNCCRLDFRLEEHSFIQDVRQFISSTVMADRRKNNRFDWSLESRLSFDGDNWQEYRLRSLSSSGAFLECDSYFPNPGDKAMLQIIFENFKMNTRCIILDPRNVSSNLPMGFGVKFIDISDASRAVIDQIVNKALMQVLLNQEKEPELPALEDESQLTESFDLI